MLSFFFLQINKSLISLQEYLPNLIIAFLLKSWGDKSKNLFKLSHVKLKLLIDAFCHHSKVMMRKLLALKEA